MDFQLPTASPRAKKDASHRGPFLRAESREDVQGLVLIARASKIFSEVSFDFEQALVAICRILSEGLGDMSVLRLTSADGTMLEPAALHHWFPDRKKRLDGLVSESWPIADGTMGQVLRTGNAILVRREELAVVADGLPLRCRRYVEEVGLESLILAPLRARGRVLGILAVARDADSPGYDEGHVLLVQELADRAAITLDNCRRYREAAERGRGRDA